MLDGPNVSTSRRRLAGYREALQAWRCPFDPCLVVAGDFRVEAGYDSGITLLKRGPDAAELLFETIEPPDGVAKRYTVKTVTLKTTLHIRESCGYELRARRRSYELRASRRSKPPADTPAETPAEMIGERPQ